MVNEKIKQELRVSWVIRVDLWLERSSAGEARVDVVPPLQFVAFAHLPAEQYDAAVAK